MRDTCDSLVQDPLVITFRDESDRLWEVREIRDPGLPERRRFLLRREYADGWLLFVSGGERRRLAPYPPGWRFADPGRLRAWVGDAAPVRDLTAGAGSNARRVCDLPPVEPCRQDTT